MPNYTTNLNLEKPLQGEFYNVDIFNANADKIDAAVGNISTNTYQKPTGGIPLSDVSSQITDRLDWYGTTTGGVNLVLNIPEFVGTLKAGTVLRFRTGSGGTGSYTLNFNGNGAKRINRSNGSQINRVDAGAIYTVVYDGTNFILQGEGGSGNALSGEILQGRTATTDNGEIVGTMPNRGSVNITLNIDSNTFNIPSGYHSGGGLVTANYSNTRRYFTNDYVYPGGNGLIGITLPFDASTVYCFSGYGSFSYVIKHPVTNIYFRNTGGSYSGSVEYNASTRIVQIATNVEGGTYRVIAYS